MNPTPKPTRPERVRHLLKVLGLDVLIPAIFCLCLMASCIAQYEKMSAKEETAYLEAKARVSRLELSTTLTPTGLEVLTRWLAFGDDGYANSDVNRDIKPWMDAYGERYAKVDATGIATTGSTSAAAGQTFGPPPAIYNRVAFTNEAGVRGQQAVDQQKAAALAAKKANNAPATKPLVNTTLPDAAAPAVPGAPVILAADTGFFGGPLNVKGNNAYFFTFDHNDGTASGKINISSTNIVQLNVIGHPLGPIPITAHVPFGPSTVTVKFNTGNGTHPDYIDGKLTVTPAGGPNPPATVNSGGSTTFRVVPGGAGAVLSVQGAP